LSNEHDTVPIEVSYAEETYWMLSSLSNVMVMYCHQYILLCYFL